MDAAQYHLEDILRRLSHIDWNHLKDRFGIEKETVLGSETIARQLAYGEYTDLIPGCTDELVGLFSLKADPSEDEGFWKVTAYTMEKPKTGEDDIFLYGIRIRSEAMRRTLLERSDWEARDGTRRYGLANANAGSPVVIEVDGRRIPYLISMHQQTNRIVGMPLDQVRGYFLDGKGLSRGKGMYGVTFTDSQIRTLCDSGVVWLEGCRDRDGATFNCFVQFDASRRQPVVCHPTWIKDVQRTGIDLGLSPKII